MTENSPKASRALRGHEIRALGKGPPDCRGVQAEIDLERRNRKAYRGINRTGVAGMRRANKLFKAGHISNDQYCQLFRVFRVQHEAAVFALLLIEALGERHPDPVEIDRPEHPATLDRGRDPRLRAQPPPRDSDITALSPPSF